MKIYSVHGRFDKYHEGRPLQKDYYGVPTHKYIWDQSRLDVEIDHDLPLDEERITQKLVHDDGIFYVTDLGDGLFSFYHHIHDLSKNTDGYGGHVFEARLPDGTIEKVPGPWSSSYIHYNSLVPEEDWLFN